MFDAIEHSSDANVNHNAAPKNSRLVPNRSAAQPASGMTGHLRERVTRYRPRDDGLSGSELHNERALRDADDRGVQDRHYRGENADTGDAQQAGIERIRIVRQVAGGRFGVRSRRCRARNHDRQPNEKIAS